MIIVGATYLEYYFFPLTDPSLCYKKYVNQLIKNKRPNHFKSCRIQAFFKQTAAIHMPGSGQHKLRSMSTQQIALSDYCQSLSKVQTPARV